MMMIDEMKEARCPRKAIGPETTMTSKGDRKTGRQRRHPKTTVTQLANLQQKNTKVNRIFIK
jgi:hypothetical protein